MDAYQNYEAKRSSAENFKKRSAPFVLFAVVALITGIAEFSTDHVPMGWVGKNLGWEGTIGVPALLLAVIAGIRWFNNRSVREAGKAWADEGLKREGRP